MSAGGEDLERVDSSLGVPRQMCVGTGVGIRCCEKGCPWEARRERTGQVVHVHWREGPGAAGVQEPGGNAAHFCSSGRLGVAGFPSPCVLDGLPVAISLSFGN